MIRNQPENHPNGYTSKQLAMVDARLAVAMLCAADRSPAYKAAISEALRALNEVAQVEHGDPPEPSIDDAQLWAAAVAAAGTQKVPPYGFPVIVLARPADVVAVYRAISKAVRPEPQAPPAQAVELGVSDRERLLHIARVLRAIADLGSKAPLGPLWSEVLESISTLKGVLNITTEQSTALGLRAKSMLPGDEASSAAANLSRGWLEAANAWHECASIHRSFGKGTDASFEARQAEFTRHAEAARTRYSDIFGQTPDINAA